MGNAGRFSGKVVLVTGAARGQGRSHAVRFAQEGADVIAVDLCGQVGSVEYEMGTEEDMAQTVREVEAHDQRIVARTADVRDQDELDAAVHAGVAELGRLDIVSANAGIVTTGKSWELPEATWRDMIDVNLTGVWHAVKAAAPTLIEAGNGGVIVITSSLCGVKGLENVSHYVAAKHGVIGLMKSLAQELGPYKIRVNSVLPGSTRTKMFDNVINYRVFRPDLDDPGPEDVIEPMRALTVLQDVDYMEPEDISNAVLWLASDEARFITGVGLSVDAGWHLK